MLRMRVIAALVMVAGFLGAIAFISLPGLALLFGLIVSLGAWEWGPMAGWSSVPARSLYVLVLVACLVGLYFYGDLGGEAAVQDIQPIMGLACLWWAIALLWVKAYPASGALWGSRPMRSLMGLLILAPAWTAAIFLLTYPRGGVLMFALVLIVASADIGAYLSG